MSTWKTQVITKQQPDPSSVSQGDFWGGNINIAIAAIEQLSLPSLQQLGNNSWAGNTSSKHDKQLMHLKLRYYKTAEKISGEIIWYVSKAVDLVHLCCL